MASPAPKTSKKRAHDSSTDQCLHDGLSWVEAHATLYEARLDVLLAKPAARMNLPDLLWRMGPKLVVAINRGHTALELWRLCRNDSPRFQCSYRTFARALADFRAAKGLPPAYAGRKSKTAMPASVPAVLDPSSQQTKLLHPLPIGGSQKVAKDTIPPLAESQSERTPQTSPPTLTEADRVEAFLKTKFSMKHDPGISQKTLEEMNFEDMQNREAKAAAAAEAEKAEAERRRQYSG